jgi:hypothetical protein
MSKQFKIFAFLILMVSMLIGCRGNSNRALSRLVDELFDKSADSDKKDEVAKERFPYNPIYAEHVISTRYEELRKTEEGRDTLRNLFKYLSYNKLGFADSFAVSQKDIFLKLERMKGVEEAHSVIKASFGDSILKAWKRNRI